MESPTSEVVNLIEAAVQALLGPGSLTERIANARVQIEQINGLGLRRALLEQLAAEQQTVIAWVAANRHTFPPRSANAGGRGTMYETTRLRMYRRDAFTCRYSRCRLRTIYLPVLRDVASVIPDLLGTNSNWRPLDLHVVYWMCTSTLEHRVAFPHGGSESGENYLTACSRCQYVKNEYPLADTLWQVDDVDPGAGSPTFELGRWDGLSWSLAPLRVALGRPITDVLTGRPIAGVAKVGSVIRPVASGGTYQVDAVDERCTQVRLLWTSGGRTVASGRTRWVDVADGDWVELLPSMEL